jgi:hypothetical protein
VWTPVAWTRPLSLFSYYRPQEIAVSGLSLHEPAVLAVVTIVGLALAALVFTRRDL